ncbi:glycine-rich domain-containing protein [Duganella phyllosphaerae]|uniref:Glycine-rich domain-containing protein-like n=1 Tax=Duganella phyllosphaerae TaxID=762836 RepID=A0A1E7WDX9_9BURK|nr:glycine-rich domain-containing protein-like [Duganella phyllosphaerae]OEZ96223.1 hypothetical protein DUPY_40020 [Duganella phyllosphaerae]
MNAIAALDLEPIKVKLMHKESGEGWTLERANAVELEYRRFLSLMKKFPDEQTSPLVDVDTFWHYHILDTMKYAADCQAVFGYFLHHFPYIGMRGEEDAATLVRIGNRMKELYEAEFGVAYGSAAAAAGAAYCGSATVQANQNAYCGSATAAYCGSATAAYCGSATVKAGAYAYCGSTTAAYCGSAISPQVSPLYTERPRLS